MSKQITVPIMKENLLPRKCNTCGNDMACDIYLTMPPKYGEPFCTVCKTQSQYTPKEVTKQVQVPIEWFEEATRLTKEIMNSREAMWAIHRLIGHIESAYCIFGAEHIIKQNNEDT